MQILIWEENAFTYKDLVYHVSLVITHFILHINS